MPPPINTNMQYGHPSQQQMYAQQPPNGPPGYPVQGQAPYGYAPQAIPQQHGAQQDYRRPAEVEGNNRNKAQLIVGIDFVSLAPYHTPIVASHVVD